MEWGWEGCWGAGPATQSADWLGKWSLETHRVLPTTPSCLFVAIIFGFLAPHSSSSLEYGSQASFSSHSHRCPVWPGWHSNVLEFLRKSSTGLLLCVNSRDPQLLSFLGCTESHCNSSQFPSGNQNPMARLSNHNHLLSPPTTPGFLHHGDPYL